MTEALDSPAGAMSYASISFAYVRRAQDGPARRSTSDYTQSPHIRVRPRLHLIDASGAFEVPPNAARASSSLFPKMRARLDALGQLMSVVCAQASRSMTYCHRLETIPALAQVL
ncbi:hypothetical protein VTO73DRAFT_1498 [Trametes versicolor]